MAISRRRRALLFGAVLLGCASVVAFVVALVGCGGTVGPTLPSPGGEGVWCTSALINPPDNSGGNIVVGTPTGQVQFLPNDPTLADPIFPSPVTLPALGSIPPSSADYEPTSNQTLSGGEYNYANITINDGITVWFNGSTTLTANGDLAIYGAGRIYCMAGDLEIRVQGNVTMDGGQIVTDAPATSDSANLTLKCGGGMDLVQASIRSSDFADSDGGGVLVAALGGDIVADETSISATVTQYSGPDRNCTVVASGKITLGYSCSIDAGNDNEATGGNVLVGTVNGDIELGEMSMVRAMGGASGHAVEVRSGQGVSMTSGAMVFQRLGHILDVPPGVSIYALDGPIDVGANCEVYTGSVYPNGYRGSANVLLQARGEVVLADYASIYTSSAEGSSGNVTIIGYRCAEQESPAVQFVNKYTDVHTGDGGEMEVGNVEIQGFVNSEGASDAIVWGTNKIETGAGGEGGDVTLRTRCCNGYN
jgi:hypothetical protein